MLAVILATTLSVSQVLPALEAFCTNAEIEIRRPLTEQMVSEQIVEPEHGRVQGVIQGRYRFSYWRGKMEEFADRNENIFRRLNRLDPADMVKWSREPCSITETDALEMATRIFRRLGYSEKDFDPPEAKRSRWIPNPGNPEDFLLIPIYGVRWFQKGSSRELAVPPKVEFVISGTTRHLVYFSDTRWSETFAEKVLTAFLPKPPPEEQPSIELKEALRICEPMLKAIGAQINGPLEQHAKLRLPDERTKQILGKGIRPFLNIDDRYLFEISFGKLREFNDFHERPICVLEVENPQRLKEMSQEKCSLNEKQALQIALKFFHNLGFRDRNFYPPEVSRHLNGTSPFFGLDPADFYWSEHPKHPATPLTLPDSFRVEWAGKGLIDALLGKQQFEVIEISGVTSNLIFYWHSPP